MKVFKYVMLRVLMWAITIWIGVTLIFIIPRLMPSDPVENMLMLMEHAAGPMPAVEREAMMAQMRMQFGLDESLWNQYVFFLVNGVLRLDFGPSLMNFPTPASDIIFRNLPYTFGLMFTSLILTWTIGNAIGMRAGFRKHRLSSKIMESIAIFIYPIPIFIIALFFQIVFGFMLGWFPLTAIIFGEPWTAPWISGLMRAAAMPLMAMFVGGLGWWIISMKSLSMSTAQEDFVLFAKYRGIGEGTIGRRYVLRNTILPQVTMLGLSMGGVFGGSVLVENIFSFPGVGRLMVAAVGASDYNMIMGCVTISIIAITTATLMVDLIIPFIDPRVRRE